MTYKKKLIEVALPLEAINVASAREKTIRHGHPSNLHRWWARRPLAAARAMIFAQMVDDPSSHPDLFKTEKAQEKERQRLFRIIEELVKWESTSNQTILQKARDEIWQSWRYTCAENADHPRAKELFDRFVLPGFHDPFGGGGALPLEGQRLGLESYATDLNPVAVLINKAMIEIPPKFIGKSPVNPDAKLQHAFSGSWSGIQGLTEDVRYYGTWIKNQAAKKIGDLYPSYSVTKSQALDRPDLTKYVGRNLTVIAWVWARTVASPNPAFSGIQVPLVSSFLLSSKTGKEAYVEPFITDDGYQFIVKVGKPLNIDAIKNGTKLARGANFKCLMSDIPMPSEHIKAEGKAGRMGARLMAIVAEGDRERVYLTPTPDMEAIALNAHPNWKPDTILPADMRSHWTPPYGLTKYGDLFTNRQLLTLTTFCDLIEEAREKIKKDGIANNESDDLVSLENGGAGLTAYADSVAVYLALIVSKTTDSNNSLCPWEPVAQCTRQLFGRQAIPMMWDFGEANPLHDSSGGLLTNIEGSIRSFANFAQSPTKGFATQDDAATQVISNGKVISTDPPYYDNIGYADLSDFFYIWLRRALKPILPVLFATLEVPKSAELVATPYRHGGKEKAEIFFLDGMTQAMHRLAEQAHPAFPVTIYYAFKQSEGDAIEGTASTGWETFLDAVIRAGFEITGTWPVRSEMTAALKNLTNSLASSIVLVCRQRSLQAQNVTRREFITSLKSELPEALKNLQAGNIAPVDLAQAAIGPGMAVYTRFSKVIDAEGNSLSVRGALALINQTLDESLAQQEGDFDADSRWALTWFEQFGFDQGDYGIAEQLSKSKNTTIAGLVDTGILLSKAKRVRLLKPAELDVTPDGDVGVKPSAWKIVHQLIQSLESGGESSAGELVNKIGESAETARELCYRLYTLCERNKRAVEAMAYNGLVQSWPEIMRIANGKPSAASAVTNDLFNQE
jgi:putative DNA methylase